MRFKISPLFAASIGVVIFGFFYIFYQIDSSLGPLAGILLMFCGFLCLGIYFILCIVFRTKFWLQFLSEIVLIILISFSSYKMSGKVLLHIPAKFNGNIMLVYGVDKRPKLRSLSFFYRNIDVVVPPSGIVLIANKYAPKYFNNLLIIDSANHRVAEPGLGVSYAVDILRCPKRYYITEVLNYTYPLNANLKSDSLNHKLQKQAACSLLDN
jgi:hypothetical protein